MLAGEKNIEFSNWTDLNYYFSFVMGNPNLVLLNQLTLEENRSNPQPKMVGYERYRSVIQIKPTVKGGQLNPGQLCKLVVFNTYNRPWWWSVMCYCILRNMVPHDPTCHHGRLCPFYSLLTRFKTNRGQTFSHGRLCAVGYDSVGFTPVRFPNLYNRPPHNRPSLKEDGRFSGFVYNISGQFYMNAISFLVMVW